jgi:adenylate cyclase
VVDAVECAAPIQRLMLERNAEIPESKRIVYRVGVHLGDLLIEGDDILGEGSISRRVWRASANPAGC